MAACQLSEQKHTYYGPNYFWTIAHGNKLYISQTAELARVAVESKFGGIIDVRVWKQGKVFTETMIAFQVSNFQPGQWQCLLISNFVCPIRKQSFLFDGMFLASLLHSTDDSRFGGQHTATAEQQRKVEVLLNQFRDDNTVNGAATMCSMSLFVRLWLHVCLCVVVVMQ